MAQERALQITFVDGKYGYSGFPYPDAQRAFAEGLRDRVATAKTFQIYSNFGRIRVGRNGAYKPLSEEELKFEGVVRDDDYDGTPSEETLKKIASIDGTPVIEIHSKTGDIRVYYPYHYLVAEPLTGRIYDVFKSDCWSLCREYLLDNYGIRLPAGTMEISKELADRLGRNFFLEACKENGFKEVILPQPGDIIVTGVDMFHTAVYLEGGRMLHMFPGRLSAIEQYDGYLESSTVAIMRHEALA